MIHLLEILIFLILYFYIEQEYLQNNMVVIPQEINIEHIQFHNYHFLFLYPFELTFMGLNRQEIHKMILLYLHFQYFILKDQNQLILYYPNRLIRYFMVLSHDRSHFFYEDTKLPKLIDKQKI